MSGGHFYISPYAIAEVEREIREVVAANHTGQKDEVGFPLDREYDEGTICYLNKVAALVHLTYRVLRITDYMISGDTSPERACKQMDEVGLGALDVSKVPIQDDD